MVEHRPPVVLGEQVAERRVQLVDVAHHHRRDLRQDAQGNGTRGAVEVEGVEAAEVIDGLATARHLEPVSQLGQTGLGQAAFEVATSTGAERLDVGQRGDGSEVVGERTTGQQEDLEVEVGVVLEPAEPAPAARPALLDLDQVGRRQAQQAGFR